MTTRTRRLLVLAGLLGLMVPAAAGPAAAQAAACDGIAGTATAAPNGLPAETPGVRPYEKLSGWDPALDLGIGRLTAEQIKPFDTNWYDNARLPLFAAPGGAQWGWIAKGWLLELNGGRAAPLGTRGLVETGYETPSFIVLGETEDGWLEFRWDIAAAGRGGTAWLHRCHLDGDGFALRFQPWSDLFRGAETVPLLFRSTVRHSLRAGPGAEHRRLGWIEGGDTHLEPLELRGDWMRVRVKQPSDACAEPGTVQSKVTEGWTKWRSPKQGPWVWYHTRGC